MIYTNMELSRIAASYGAKDVPRVVSGIALAVQRFNEDPHAMLNSLYKHQPELFYGGKR
jgi:hypothetical protein